MGPGERVDTESNGEILESPVAFAVLGLVIEKPSYGYNIWKRFGPRFGFLATSTSPIYKALAGLTGAGLIEEMTGIPSVGVARGAKAGPSYRATAPGVRAYRRRVAERIREDPRREETLGHMVLAGIDGVAAALDLLDRYEEQCLLKLQDMTPAAGSWRALNDVSRLVERLITEGRRRAVDAELKWVDQARAELRAFAGGDQNEGEGSR